jgi:hypothetical protein
VRRSRLHFRLVVLAAWLALAAQGLLVFEAAWHHHDEATDGQQDSCAVCAAVAEKGQPIDPPVAAPALAFTEFLPERAQERPAHRFALPGLTSRGPPSTAAL